MGICCIFVDDKTKEGLYAFHYKGQKHDTFTLLMQQWTNPQFVTEYCINNQDHIKAEYFKRRGIESVDAIISRIIKEAAVIGNLLYDYVKEGFEKKGKDLQMLFRPLVNTEAVVHAHQKSKTKVLEIYGRNPVLRLYAIKLGCNTYVITGGAIKLTATMQEHEDTKRELQKLELVKTHLKENGIYFDEDLIYYYEEQKK